MTRISCLVYFMLIIIVCINADIKDGKVEPGTQELLPITLSKAAGVIVFVFLLLLSVIGGLGGGTVAVLVLTTFYKLPMAAAAAISHQVTLVSTLIQFFGFYLTMNHPYTKGPIIDYGVAIIILPMAMFGTKIGLFCYRVLPNTMLELFFLTIGIVFAIASIVKVVLLLASTSPRWVPQTEQNESRLEMPNYGVNREELEEPSATPQQYPYGKILFSIGMLAFIILVDLTQGSKSTPSIIGLSNCDAGYFVLFGVILIVVLGFSWVSFCLYNQGNNVANMSLTTGKSVGLLSLAFFAGFCNATAGISGASVIGPILNLYGMLPEVTAATCVYIVGLVNINSALLFFIHGHLLVQILILFLIVTVLVVVLGRLITLFCCLNKDKLQVYVAISLALVLTISAIIIPIHLFKEGIDFTYIFAWKPFCSGK